MLPFRTQHPKRTYSKVHSNYRDYKPFLAKDFNCKCGYTDCNDFWFGGKDNFHIDHFIPWKGKPNSAKLKCDYQNLVYCCSYVNIAKSNDEGNYLDPCNIDFNKHFSRNDVGVIIPIKTSSKAVYMHNKLKLYLKRFQIIWLLDQLDDRMTKLVERIEKHGKTDELNSLLTDITIEYSKYKKYLRAL